MDVKTLCLGLLTVREACGYDLKKTFESSFKHFFPAGYGSIYPALADLADSGLVSCREIPQVGKPDRKVYSITEAGGKAFAEALKRTDPQHKLRSEFLVMIYFADRLDNERLADLLDDRVEKLRETIKHIELVSNQTDAPNSPGASFVAGFGAVIAEAAARYIESNRHLLTNSQESDTDIHIKAAIG